MIPLEVGLNFTLKKLSVPYFQAPKGTFKFPLFLFLTFMPGIAAV